MDGGREVGRSRSGGGGGRLALALLLLEFPYSHFFFLFHFCKMIKIVYILKGVSRVWSSVRWKPEVAGLLRTGFHPVPIHSHVWYHGFLFR